MNPTLINVAHTMYKLTQGTSLLSCSEQFAIDKATMCKALREVVKAINTQLQGEIQFSRGTGMIDNMVEFRKWCDL